MLIALMSSSLYEHLDWSHRKTPHGEEVFTLFLPQPALDLGTPPRLCYPLVIFLIRNEGRTMHPDETVSSILPMVDIRMWKWSSTFMVFIELSAHKRLLLILINFSFLIII
jgi:hypothetical protein